MPPIVIVYDKDPVDVINIFRSLYIEPYVDHKHDYKNHFIEKYGGDNYRLYWTKPFLLFGKNPDIDYDITGNPSFSIAFSDPLSEQEWDAVNSYMQWKFDKMEHFSLQVIDKARDLLKGTPVSFPINQVVRDKDNLVIERDGHKNFYEFFYNHYNENTMICSVHKPFVTLPFTVVLNDFKEYGFLHFFTDLFNSAEWGNSYADCYFLSKIWNELDMGGELDKERLDGLLEERVKMFLPEDGECKVEPKVYRKSLASVVEMIDASFTNKV